jgi:hypothetical protein
VSVHTSTIDACLPWSSEVLQTQLRKRSLAPSFPWIKPRSGLGRILEKVATALPRCSRNRAVISDRSLCHLPGDRGQSQPDSSSSTAGSMLSLMEADLGHDEALGSVLCRHEGVMLTGGLLDRFVASDSPWMVFEVHARGIRIQTDPRMAARIRRIINALLGVFYPGGFDRLSGLSRLQPVVWLWPQLKSVHSSAAKVLAIESSSGIVTEFRFGTSRGLKDTLVKLANSDASPSSVSIQKPMS